MAKARALDKRRKSIRNIKKITRTMELIATARFRKAMDRAQAASNYTEKIIQIVRDIAASGTLVMHPLLIPRENPRRSLLLVLTANRGLCGGYNAAVVRQAIPRYRQLTEEMEHVQLEVAGKRGIGALRFRQIQVDETFLQFDDQPRWEQVEPIANRYLEWYVSGRIDRLDVIYTKFISGSRQDPVTETLLPLSSLEEAQTAMAETAEMAGQMPEAAAASPDAAATAAQGARGKGESMYEFLPSAANILEEVVPASFRVRLFQCFLDAAVSEQIARRVAMRAATENAEEMIKHLSMTYNRARQSQITNEIMEIIGGVEALSD